MFGREWWKGGAGGSEGRGKRRVDNEQECGLWPCTWQGYLFLRLEGRFRTSGCQKKVVGRETRWSGEASAATTWASFASSTHFKSPASKTFSWNPSRTCWIVVACSPSLFLSFSIALKRHLLSGHRKHVTSVISVCSLKLCASSASWDSDFTIAAVTCTEDRPDVTAGCSVTLSELQAVNCRLKARESRLVHLSRSATGRRDRAAPGPGNLGTACSLLRAFGRTPTSRRP